MEDPGECEENVRSHGSGEEGELPGTDKEMEVVQEHGLRTDWVEAEAERNHGNCVVRSCCDPTTDSCRCRVWSHRSKMVEEEVRGSSSLCWAVLSGCVPMVTVATTVWQQVAVGTWNRQDRQQNTAVSSRNDGKAGNHGDEDGRHVNQTEHDTEVVPLQY